MKTIVEIGFTVKAVSWDTVFITPISQVNGTGTAMVNSGTVNSTVESTDINLLVMVMHCTWLWLWLCIGNALYILF